MHSRGIHTALVVWISIAACDDQAAEGGVFGFPREGDFSVDAGTAEPPGQGATDPDEGEVEVEAAFETPTAGGRYVYVANPLRDMVAVVDSQTLRIESVEVGDGPTVVATRPPRDEAVVLNVRSHDLSWLETTSQGTSVRSFPVTDGANALALAPQGGHAIAYFDSFEGSGSGGLRTLQEVTVVTLETGSEASYDVTVGFRPIEVQFSEDGSTGFVVTEDGISAIDFDALTGPIVAPTIFLQGARDVSVTRDGRFAIGRSDTDTRLLLVDLTEGSVRTLDLEAPITDLDLVGSERRAIAMMKSESAAAILDLPADFDDPSQIDRVLFDGEVVGSIVVSADGLTAIAYTTELGVERISVLRLDTLAAQLPITLRKSVRSIAIGPDAGIALVVHQPEPGNPNDPSASLDDRIDRSHGYSVVDLRSAFAKLELTAALPGALAATADGEHAFVILRDDARGVRELHHIRLASLLIDRIALPSPPRSLGILDVTARAYVGQEHPGGRITFFEWNTQTVESVTGFELNSRIVE